MGRTVAAPLRTLILLAAAWSLLTLATLNASCKSAAVDPFLARHKNSAEHEEKQDEPDAKKAELAADKPAQPEESAAEESVAETAADNAVDLAASVEALGTLESDAWTEAATLAYVKRAPGDRRWHHAQLDPLLKLKANHRPDLTASLASDNLVVATNAAIVAAHWGQAGSCEPLKRAVLTKSLRNPLRCAAAEALAVCPDAEAADALRASLKQIAGPPEPRAEDEALPRAVNPDLQADLIRALGTKRDPADHAWLIAAIRHDVWKVRFEGIEAFALQTDVQLPMVAIDLRSDQDPRIRAAALRAIAAHRDPHALEYLKQALTDRTVEVHTTAVAALGELGSDDARSALTKLKNDGKELSRAAAITALAVAGAQEEAQAAIKDTSQHVRLAVAQSLARASEEGHEVAKQSIETAQTLSRDGSAEVQREAINSMAQWPLEQAGPLLLTAIAEGGYTARKTAAKQLAQRWPPALDFPVDAVADRRAEALAALKKQWVAQYGEARAQVETAKSEVRQAIHLAEDKRAVIESALATLQQANVSETAHRAALTALESAGPALIPVLEEQAQLGPLPAELYEEVLPSVDTNFAQLRRLASGELLLRRTVASEMAAITEPMSLLALERLAELVEREKDPVVWRGVLIAVAADGREPATRMAYTAIGNSSVEVRRKACEYLAAHGDPRHVQALLPVLEDTDGTVVLAGIRALGAMGTIEDPRPLVHLLGQPDKHVRLESAMSLARLHCEQGVAALERLAIDKELEFRLRAAKAMGELADPAFLPTLVTMLDDRFDVQRVAMISLTQIAGEDAAAEEPGMPLSPDEKVRRWQLWYRDHKQSLASQP